MHLCMEQPSGCCSETNKPAEFCYTLPLCRIWPGSFYSATNFQATSRTVSCFETVKDMISVTVLRGAFKILTQNTNAILPMLGNSIRRNGLPEARIKPDATGKKKKKKCPLLFVWDLPLNIKSGLKQSDFREAMKNYSQHYHWVAEPGPVHNLVLWSNWHDQWSFVTNCIL